MPDVIPVQARALVSSAGQPPRLNICRSLGRPAGCRQIMEDWLRLLDDQLRRQPAEADRRGVRQSLRELAELIAADRLGLSRGDHQRLLARLAATFATGLTPASQSLLAAMAPSYAGVVAAISRACPSCDYEASLGQLLSYMARLLLDRRGGWKTVFRNIQAVSKETTAKQRLDDVEFARLEEWVESGAANLFPLQRDLEGAIARLDAQIAALDGEISRRAAVLQQSAEERRAAQRLPNVLFLDAWREGRDIGELRRQRQDRLDELAAKREIKDLIDADIRGFEDCLLAIRRSYFMRLVWTAA